MTEFEPVTYTQKESKKEKITTIIISALTLIFAVGAGFAGFKLYQLQKSTSQEEPVQAPQVFQQEAVSPTPKATSSAFPLTCEDLTVQGKLFAGEEVKLYCQHSGTGFSHYNYRYKPDSQTSWVYPSAWQEATTSAQWQIPQQAVGQDYTLQCQACNTQLQCTAWGEVKGIFTAPVSFFNSLTPNKIFVLVIIAVWTVGTIIVAILTYRSRKNYKLASALTIILTAALLSLAAYFVYNNFLKDALQLPAQTSPSPSPISTPTPSPSPSLSPPEPDPCTLELTIPQKTLTATASASPTPSPQESLVPKQIPSPSPSPSPLPSPSPSPSPTPTPTPTPSPSPSPSLIAKVIPSPSPIAEATAPAKQLPEAGTTIPTFALTLGGIILIAIGALLF